MITSLLANDWTDLAEIWRQGVRPDSELICQRKFRTKNSFQNGAPKGLTIWSLFFPKFSVEYFSQFWRHRLEAARKVPARWGKGKNDCFKIINSVWRHHYRFIDFKSLQGPGLIWQLNSLEMGWKNFLSNCPTDYVARFSISIYIHP